MTPIPDSQIKSLIKIIIMSPTDNTKQATWVAVGSPCSFSITIVSSLILSRYFNMFKNEQNIYGAVIQPRVVVPNDTKMFGQASCEVDICSFVSADSEAKKVYDLLKQPNFEFIDIRKDV